MVFVAGVAFNPLANASDKGAADFSTLPGALPSGRVGAGPAGGGGGQPKGAGGQPKGGGMRP